jgi:uncharacterized protein with HEPN domain
MIERVISPRLADIVEAIGRIHRVLDGVPLEAFEQDWEKRWLVERGIEIISEASRHLTEEIKARQAEIPWSKIAGIGNVLRHAYDHIAPDVLWKLARDDLPALEKVLPRRTRCGRAARTSTVAVNVPRRADRVTLIFWDGTCAYLPKGSNMSASAGRNVQLQWTRTMAIGSDFPYQV